MLIPTLSGTMRGDLDDWVIRGVKDEIYPCAPEIFAATYDAVDAHPRRVRACRLIIEVVPDDGAASGPPVSLAFVVDSYASGSQGIELRAVPA